MYRMTTKIFWIAVALFLSSGSGLCASYKIYIFMGETCPVSRHYTVTLKKLHAEYASEKLEFIGVFPNRLSTPATIAAFKEKYALPFTCIGDATHTWVNRLGATITPEVVVADTSHTAIYRGRIDNTFADLGKRRRVITEHDLADILNALKNEKPPVFRQTQAIGCIITSWQNTKE